VRPGGPRHRGARSNPSPPQPEPEPEPESEPEPEPEPEPSGTKACAAVEALLRPPLESMAQQEGGVLPQLVEAATRLVAALELGSSKRVAGTKGEAEHGG